MGKSQKPCAQNKGTLRSTHGTWHSGRFTWSHLTWISGGMRGGQNRRSHKTGGASGGKETKDGGAIVSTGGQCRNTRPKGTPGLSVAIPKRKKTRENKKFPEDTDKSTDINQFTKTQCSPGRGHGFFRFPRDRSGKSP